MVISSLLSIWIYTVYCFCRCNFITFLFPSLIFRNQVFYITPISYSMQAEIRPMACGQRKLKQHHFYCQLVDFQSFFHRYYILSDGVLFNVINCSEIDNGDDIISSELVRKYHAALLQWNLYVSCCFATVEFVLLKRALSVLEVLGP